MTRLVAAIALAGALIGCAQGSSNDDGLVLDSLKLPSSLKSSDFTAPLNKASIRSLQTWISDAGFEVKWQSMLAAPLNMLGGASSAFNADLATLPASKLPGDEVLCHGDPKIDNFGWVLIDGDGVFSDSDFDDASYCPVADDILHYLLATDLAFNDADLDRAALEAYVDTVDDKGDATDVSGKTEPDWDDLAASALAKSASGETLVLGGEVQAATAAEVSAVRSLAASDLRFPPIVLDVARDVKTDGGSAGLRRFWLLTDDGSGEQTIVEIKELAEPGAEFARHTLTLDGASRFDVLKSFWWDDSPTDDDFGVNLLGARWVVRDRLTRTNIDPSKLSSKQLSNVVQAEASLMALRHRKAWHSVKKSDLRSWLSSSSSTLVSRWRAMYKAAGGK